MVYAGIFPDAGRLQDVDGSPTRDSSREVCLELIGYGQNLIVDYLSIGSIVKSAVIVARGGGDGQVEGFSACLLHVDHNPMRPC